MSAGVRIRAAALADAAALNRIYNHYVLCSAATFDVEAWDLARRKTWLRGFQSGGPYHALVAESEGEGAASRVVGFACNARFRARAAYKYSTESAVYVAPEVQRRGVGAALYGALFARLAAENLHRVYAAVALPNPASVALHLRFGFLQTGVWNQAGYKFGRYISVANFEKALR